MTSTIKFINLLENIRSYIKSDEHQLDISKDEYIFNLIKQLHNLDKNKQIILHLREYYNDEYHNKNSDDYIIMDRVVVFNNKFKTRDQSYLSDSMSCIYDTYDWIKASDPNKDIYQLGGELFNIPGYLLHDEVDQLYCVI